MLFRSNPLGESLARQFPSHVVFFHSEASLGHRPFRVSHLSKFSNSLEAFLRLA